MAKVLRSFKPWIDKKSRVLILGSMPGPEALRKQQYYGFDGNHFWHIIPKLFSVDRPTVYSEKLKLIRKNRIALWDVLASCVRPSALDSAIRHPKPNKIPELLKKFPNIQAIFINGKYAYNTFVKIHGDKIERPVFYLPSTSPANAAMPLAVKVKHWRAIKKYLNPS